MTDHIIYRAGVDKLTMEQALALSAEIIADQKRHEEVKPTKPKPA